MAVSEAEEIKHLRDENSQLNKLIADLIRDKEIPELVIGGRSFHS